MIKHQQIVIVAIIGIIDAFNPVLAVDKVTDSAGIGKHVLTAGFGFADDAAPLEAQLGIAVGALPEYQGARDYHASALPLVDISKAGGFFVRGAGINVNDGLLSAGLTLFHIDYSQNAEHRIQLTMGPLVRMHRGRDDSDSSVLNGLGDIDQSVAVGGFMQFKSGPWQASVTLSPEDVGNDSDGLLLTLDVVHNIKVSKAWDIKTVLSSSWADDDYMQGYFGVTAAQNVASGLSVFDAKSGFKDVGLQLKAIHTLSPQWSVHGQLGYWHLLNDASDSPLVEDAGSADQIRGLLGITYRF